MEGYGRDRNVSPCQSSRPQDRFFGRKFSSLQLGDGCGGKGGVSLDRLVVVVATQEEQEKEIQEDEREKNILQNHLQTVGNGY